MSWGLFGVVVLQTCAFSLLHMSLRVRMTPLQTYIFNGIQKTVGSSNFQVNDRRFIQCSTAFLTFLCLVLSFLVLECADTAISTNATWLFMVSGWGNPATLTAAPWSFSVAIILTALSKCTPSKRSRRLINSIQLLISLKSSSLGGCGCSVKTCLFAVSLSWYASGFFFF